jgi:hypothetical protein
MLLLSLLLSFLQLGCLSQRFSELPIAQLPTAHNDPDIAAGLVAIQKLDEKLKEVSLQVSVD